jgi:hypothetical protein
MAKMSLRKALQKKNLIVGKIRGLQTLISSKNVFTDETPENNREDTKVLLADLVKMRDGLIALKSAVTVANVPIYPTLARISELKSYIEFLNGISTNEGKTTQRVHGFSQEVLVMVNKATLSEKDIRALKEETEKEIEILQEKVDDFNASTFIEVDL